MSLHDSSGTPQRCTGAEGGGTEEQLGDLQRVPVVLSQWGPTAPAGPIKLKDGRELRQPSSKRPNEWTSGRFKPLRTYMIFRLKGRICPSEFADVTNAFVMGANQATIVSQVDRDRLILHSCRRCWRFSSLLVFNRAENLVLSLSEWLL